MREIDERIEEVVEKAFEYHFEINKKCIKGERKPLTEHSRKLAIEVEVFELLNECQEWKSWKQNKTTDIEKVKEEIADVTLFTFDTFCLNRVDYIRAFNKEFLQELHSEVIGASLREIDNFKNGNILDYSIIEVMGIIIKCYEIPFEEVLQAIERKIEKNKKRIDHV